MAIFAIVVMLSSLIAFTIKLLKQNTLDLGDVMVFIFAFLVLVNS